MQECSNERRSAGAALLAALGGSRRRPPGALGDLAEALLAGRWPAANSSESFAGLPPDPSAAALAAVEGRGRLGRLARFGSDLASAIRRRPAGCRSDARLLDSGAGGVGSAGCAPSTCDDGGGGGVCMLELRVPVRGMRYLVTSLAGLGMVTALLAHGLWHMVGFFAKRFPSQPLLLAAPLFLGLLCAMCFADAAEAWVRIKLARKTVAVTARSLVLTRRLGWMRWKLEAERADTGALRLVEGLYGWRVEMELGTYAVNLGNAPMARGEAEWVIALLVARWPELAGRVEEVKDE
jgi:hypothetical protein